MTFDYKQYLDACLFNPIIVSIFFLTTLVPPLIVYIKKFISLTAEKKDILKFILFVGVFALFSFVNIGRLAYGGIYLITERATDSIVIEGEIEKVEEVSNFIFPIIESGIGTRFTVNGEKCTAIVQGEFEVGDYVVVNYLPKSGYILSIEKAENPTNTALSEPN